MHTLEGHITDFSPDESLQEQCNSYTVTKCRFKFGNLQIFCYMSNGKLVMVYGTQCQDNDIQESMKELNIKITGSRNKYYSQLFTYSRTIISYRFSVY